jgi:hypothetical protein
MGIARLVDENQPQTTSSVGIYMINKGTFLRYYKFNLLHLIWNGEWLATSKAILASCRESVNKPASPRLPFI